ncbi:MAG TPA: sigma-70 family RNA polymerase sigma factor [Kofleriaceae bacterium]|nr:sigma-70 family RNA polymerase sigma factor [Kofleriaceae bacterium]
MTTPLDFEDLVTRHQGAVCAIAYAVLRDRARSEEVAQEAFLVAWQKLPGMSPAPSLPGWVCGIARNLARNAARRRRETAMTTTEHATHDPTALDQLIAHETSALANRALATLSTREREAIVLYYRSDESLATVAAALGITEAAAKKRVLRGREHLRVAMRDVETTLRTTRPGPAFTAGCVAALALGTGAQVASAAAGAQVARAGNSKLWFAGAIAVPVLVVATVGLTHLAAAPSAAPRAATDELGATNARVDPTSAARASGEAIALPPPPSQSRRFDPVARRALVERIEEARTQRLAGTGTTPTAAAAPPRVFDFSGNNLFDDIPAPPAHDARPTTDKRVLRGAIRSVQPLIRECYEHDGHGVRGLLELYVRLEGEAGTGTIATDARVDGAFASNTALAECVRESLMSIAMPDVDVGGVVDLSYPFTVWR